jgi:RES domain-containing protein
LKTIDNPNDLPVRTITGTFFKQNAPKYHATDLPLTAEGDGRNHRDGHEPRMYASSSEDASWGEMFRHYANTAVSPFEIRRRMSTLRVIDLPVLDLTDPDVRMQLGVTETDLTSNDYAIPQQITDLVRHAPGRFGGILEPSAAMRGEQTLVIFEDRLDNHIEIEHEPIMAPPRRLFGLFELVIDTLPASLREPLRQLAAVILRDWGRS